MTKDHAIDGRLLAELLTAGSRPWAMLPESMEFLASAVSQGVVVAGPFGQPDRATSKHGGVAVVPLQGVITPSGGGPVGQLLGMGGGIASFRQELAKAAADDTVDQIVMEVNSPGGLTDRIPETAQLIRKVRERKPITAVANTMAGSAAYWLASQANEVVVAPSGEVGSIGTYMMHTDKSGANEKAGLNVTLTSAGKFKTEGNAYQPLSDEAAEARQKKVDLFYGKFVADVAEGRGVDVNEVVEGYGEGRTLLAEAAVEAGLADRVATLEETVVGLGGQKTTERIAAEADDERISIEAATRFADIALD
jgi:signal peptide peptidase SppA